ncbi:RNA polymerase sigma-70 factor [Dyadobacter bucti]|uniref:RNA polymerase sigma-70 factor n=1 Tax=Dyadobacter bucti TaxID=2572203 RepID=UPI001108C5A5|nr:RNA polymerase sigma-70 factor [Dyadobacter bucti]
MQSVEHPSFPEISFEGNMRRPSDAKPVVIDNEHLVRAAFAESANKGFEALFRLYYQALFSHAVRFVYTKEKAEDIVCEVFLDFWKSNSFNAIQGTYRSYLYAAVRNRAYTYIRYELKEERTLTSTEFSEHVSGSENPQLLIEYDELHQRIARTIDSLPSQCQRVFLLSRFEGKKNHEIATELGLALKTVEAHMAKALSQLRKAVWLTLLLLFF